MRTHKANAQILRDTRGLKEWAQAKQLVYFADALRFISIASDLAHPSYPNIQDLLQNIDNPSEAKIVVDPPLEISSNVKQAAQEILSSPFFQPDQ